LGIRRLSWTKEVIMDKGRAILAVVAAGATAGILWKWLQPAFAMELPPEPYFTWTFPSDGNFGMEVPPDVDIIALNELDPRHIPKEIITVWYNGPDEWVSWDAVESAGNLTHLIPGQDYLIVVTGPCVWNIPYMEAIWI